MKKIDEILNGVSCMAIAGHVRPDGDCIGSCLGLYQYLRDNRPEIQADVYLEDPRPEFSYLPGFSEVKTSCEEKEYDLVVLLDVSSEERIGVAAPLLAKAGKTICIDHHVTKSRMQALPARCCSGFWRKKRSPSRAPRRCTPVL